MKLTDFCIIFGAILMCLFGYNEVKLKVINETQISKMLLNINMDEIVVDGLRAGFEGVSSDGEKIVDLNAASDRIFNEISLLFYGKGNMREMAEKYVDIMLYTDTEGYYLYDLGKWNEKVMFDEECTHSERVEIISKLIEESTGQKTFLAYNDGENYKNTIGDNTMIIAYYGYNFMTSEFVYNNSFLSAADIKLID